MDGPTLIWNAPRSHARLLTIIHMQIFIFIKIPENILTFHHQSV